MIECLNSPAWCKSALLATLPVAEGSPRAGRDRILLYSRPGRPAQPPTERRAFIESFVKEIVVMPGNALMRYTVPMPDDSLIPGRVAEKVALNGSVLSIVKNGGLSGPSEGVANCLRTPAQCPTAIGPAGYVLHPGTAGDRALQDPRCVGNAGLDTGAHGAEHS